MFYVNSISCANKLLNRAETSMKRARLVSRPVELTIEPTEECNSNCVTCNNYYFRRDPGREKGFLTWNLLRKVKPFLRYAEWVVFGGAGEPLLHPEYVDMLRMIKASGPYVYVFTNGTLMSKKIAKGLVGAGMDMICISIGGGTRETYRKVRGIDSFDEVIANVKALSDYKGKIGAKKPLLSFNVVAMNSVLPEIGKIIDIAFNVGVKHVAMPHMGIYKEEMRSESIWNNLKEAKKVFDEASAKAGEKGIVFVPPPTENYKGDCTHIFKKMVINWNGMVMSCPLERYIAGDLKTDEIEDIWNGYGMIRLRKDYHKRGIEGVCPGCICWDNWPDTQLKRQLDYRKFAVRI